MIRLIIKPSVQGVGVFALEPIIAGSPLELFYADDHKFILQEEFRGVLCEQFCVRAENGWICPVDFNKMSIGWYLNHSDRPNVEEREGKHFAAGNIKGGHELTVDYNCLIHIFPEKKS